ncbi:ribosylnicotinamide kinase [Coemansia spiralis]|uniref:Ribosylnicotinamide kinase n=1 Tax=Coemansia spiralis TaxID=417178 RepID=A0A9W8L3D2_9FUNG|nr:ribosylnicotinamide kinase [Coemansia spiralis]
MSNVIVVGISGPSCSGKTAIALNLLKVFPHTVIIHQDDFYKTDSQIPTHADLGVQDWDCPHAMDMPRLVQEIRNVRQQLECRDTHSSDQIGDIRNHLASQWANPSKDVDQLISAEALASIKEQVLRSLGVAGTRQVPFSIVLVEGILLFHDNDQSSEHHPGTVCDTGVFIYAKYETLKMRRESRTSYATVEGVWADPPGYFDSLVWPNYVKYHAGFVAAHPELATDRMANKADAAQDPWGGKVVICSSDTAAEDTLRQCVLAILAEWHKRSH